MCIVRGSLLWNSFNSNSSGVWKPANPIVSQLPSKTGVERSNRLEVKILRRNSLGSNWEVFNVDLYDAVTASKAAGVICPASFHEHALFEYLQAIVMPQYNNRR